MPSTARSPTRPWPRCAVPLNCLATTCGSRLPGEYEGDGVAHDAQVIKQWTTMVLGEDELTWLKEALQPNAATDPDAEDDDLRPLDRTRGPRQ